MVVICAWPPRRPAKCHFKSSLPAGESKLQQHLLLSRQPLATARLPFPLHPTLTSYCSPSRVFLPLFCRHHSSLIPRPLRPPRLLFSRLLKGWELDRIAVSKWAEYSECEFSQKGPVRSLTSAFERSKHPSDCRRHLSSHCVYSCSYPLFLFPPSHLPIYRLIEHPGLGGHTSQTTPCIDLE
jgi:hypothetical protein